MTTFLPTDSDNNPVPALRLKDDKAHKITTSATSARNTTAFDSDTKVVSIYATEDVYLRFGDAFVSATNTDHFLPAGIYYDVAIGGEKVRQSTHVAALRATANGILHISEKG